MSRSFVAACYEVFLGRELESDQVAEDRRRLPRAEVLWSVVRSAEFEDGVHARLRRGETLGAHLFERPLSRWHRLWAADELPISPSSAKILLDLESWRDLLAVLFSDPVFCAVLDLRPLALGAHPEPALRALDQRRAAARRPLRETHDESRDFGRMLQDYCPDALANLESVGDNCELGGLQRLAGVKTPGLFRWAGVSAETLVRLLDDNLSGIEDPAHISLRVTVRDDQSAEYMIDHALFGADAHTFRSPREAAESDVLGAELRRLKLLGRKFREDLRSGRRLFVHRTGRVLTEGEARRLHDAFLRHGPNRLLIVRAAGEGLEAGEVRLLRTGLVVAALDHFALGMESYSELWPCVLLQATRLLARPLEVDIAA